MSSQKSINKMIKTDNEEEDELIRLRTAALESMHNKNTKIKDQTNSSLINEKIVNKSKVNEISGHKTRTTLNNNYYQRNGLKRSNLIVLTDTQTEFVPKNSSNSKSETLFTKLNNKSSNELSSKRKRVLPGRFSRLEREDNTDDDSEEYSDDNEDIIQFNNNSNNESNEKLCAFNKGSDEELLCFESDNTTTDVMSDIDQNSSKNGLNEETKNLININPNDCTNTINNYNNSFNNIESNNEISVKKNEEIDESLCFASTSTKVSNNYTKISSDNRKDTIKLNNNNINDISGLDVFERRKQKFGDSVTHEMITDFDNNSNHSSENSINLMINTNNKLSIKNRLTMNNSVQNEKRVYLKNCRHRSINNINSKQSNISFKGIEKSFNKRLNREIESEQDFDENQSTKKKLRSLVVMKTD